MNFELTASMMCADYRNLEKEVHLLEKAGIDSFHIDIMDGPYVPDFAMSLNYMKCIRRLTDKPLDVHLMIAHPNTNVKLFIDNLCPGDTVYIHPEAEYHHSTTLQMIIDAGMKPGIAINPGTSVETIHEMLRIADKVLVMAVNPENVEQRYLPYISSKIKRLIKLKKEMGFEIHWDGACSAEKIKEFAPVGVDGFVLGATVLFGKNRPYKEIIKNVRELKI